MLEILLNNSRSYGGYEAETSRADLAVWEQIAEKYSSVQRHSAEHGTYRVNIDWRSRVNYEQRYCELWSAISAGTDLLSNFDFEHVHVCPASVEFESPSNNKHRDGSRELHLVLADLYLMANLSVPGSFNLYRSFIRNTKLDPAKDFLAQTSLDLSEYVFETAWHEAKARPWLKVGFIPFNRVSEWFESMELSGKNTAITDLERAMFSLLHLGSASFMEPTAAMWIAGALEALFDTPSGSSFSFLCKRVVALLSLNAAETAELRRELRKFFDFRSAFIHGGGRVHHILADERDKTVEGDITNLLRTTDFASAVLVAAVQELIRRNWTGMTFREEVVPLIGHLGGAA